MKHTAIFFVIIVCTLQSCKSYDRPIAEDPCFITAREIIDGIRFQKTHEKLLPRANFDGYSPEMRPQLLEELSKRFSQSDGAMLFEGVMDAEHWEIIRYKFKTKWLPDEPLNNREIVVIPLNREPLTIPTKNYIIIEFDLDKSTSEFINFEMLDSNKLKEEKLSIIRLQEAT